MNKVRSTILIIAAIAGGAPIFHPKTKPASFSQETNNTTEAQVSPMEKKEKL